VIPKYCDTITKLGGQIPATEKDLHKASLRFGLHKHVFSAAASTATVWRWHLFLHAWFWTSTTAVAATFATPVTVLTSTFSELVLLRETTPDFVLMVSVVHVCRMLYNWHNVTHSLVEMTHIMAMYRWLNDRLNKSFQNQTTLLFCN